MRHPRTAGVAALVAVVSLLASCGQGGVSATGDVSAQETFDTAFGTSGPAPEGEPRSGGSVRYAFSTEPVSVDSANCGFSQSWMACTAVYGSLVTFDPRTLEYAPGLAESFESEDGKEWTITLRPDLTFTDGTPLDAEAVAFNWERAKDPVNRNAARQTAQSMDWEVVDERTLQVSLPAPNFQFPTLLYTGLGMIGSPTAIREKGQDFGLEPVGAGPFELDRWSRGTEMRFVRNDDYWDAPRPYLDELVIVTIAQEQQRANALKSGDIDINTTGVPRTVEELKAAGQSEAHMLNLIGAGMRFNLAAGPATDQRIREAIGHAIDSDAIREAVYSAGPGPGAFAIEGSVLFDPEAELPGHDPARAQALVDEYRAETGQDEVVLEYTSLAGVSQMVEEAQMLKAQIDAIDGLTLEVLELDAASYSSRVLAGDYESATGNMGVTLDPAMLYDRMHTNGGENNQSYSNPEFDRAIELARATSDPQEQVTRYKEAIRAYAGDVAALPWTPAATYWFHNGDIGGIAPGYNYYIRPELIWRAE
ncbi:ABC transporter substrate-binding protein [Dietzia sp. CH92]|uniref:ABC transporter substrate-binding protein n=1 Tax=Dietzia sp. CH92 TaxID=3051823 RepID=UPI0028D2FB7A|nr:ABC transporter substrate-binding protein [Dietzia sp. CH92]